MSLYERKAIRKNGADLLSINLPLTLAFCPVCHSQLVLNEFEKAWCPVCQKETEPEQESDLQLRLAQIKLYQEIQQEDWDDSALLLDQACTLLYQAGRAGWSEEILELLIYCLRRLSDLEDTSEHYNWLKEARDWQKKLRALKPDWLNHFWLAYDNLTLSRISSDSNHKKSLIYLKKDLKGMKKALVMAPEEFRPPLYALLLQQSQELIRHLEQWGYHKQAKIKAKKLADLLWLKKLNLDQPVTAANGLNDDLIRLLGQFYVPDHPEKGKRLIFHLTCQVKENLETLPDSFNMIECFNALWAAAAVFEKERNLDLAKDCLDQIFMLLKSTDFAGLSQEEPETALEIKARAWWQQGYLEKCKNRKSRAGDAYSRAAKLLETLCFMKPAYKNYSDLAACWKDMAKLKLNPETGKDLITCCTKALQAVSQGSRTEQGAKEAETSWLLLEELNTLVYDYWKKFNFSRQALDYFLGALDLVYLDGRLNEAFCDQERLSGLHRFLADIYGHFRNEEDRIYFTDLAWRSRQD